MTDTDFAPRDNPDTPKACAVCSRHIIPGDLIGLSGWLCWPCSAQLGSVIYAPAVANDPDPRTRIQARIDLLLGPARVVREAS